MQCDSQLLDKHALALKPIFVGRYRSELLTTHGTYPSLHAPIHLLNLACLRHFSSKEGRQAAARELLDFKHKPPFLISDEVGVFPTVSSKNPECIWIFSRFFKATALEKRRTKLTFDNGTDLIVPVSMHVIKMQQSRLHLLLSHAHQMKWNQLFDSIQQPYIRSIWSSLKASK